jgi:hypothetical protein
MIIVYILAVIGAASTLAAVAFVAWCSWQMRYYRRRIARQVGQEAANWQRFRAGALPIECPDGAPETEQVAAIGWQKGEVRRGTASLS